jgi:hypothetical protein
VFESLFKILLVLSCVDAKQFGTSEGDNSQQPLLLHTTELPACTLPRRRALKPSRCYLALSHLLLDPPNSSGAVNATNEQGVAARELISNDNEIANSLANTTGVCVGGLLT